MASEENVGQQLEFARPVYSGPGLASRIGSWAKYALTNNRSAAEVKASPGGKYNQYTAMVPTQSLVKYMEYDRQGKHAFPNGHSERVINDIADDLRKGGSAAMREPLWLNYDHSSRWAHLSEGHHRLEAALRAGVSHVPVMISGRGASKDERFRLALQPEREGLKPGAPLHLDTRLVENPSGRIGEDSYLPSQIHPGNFLEFEGAR